jgi:RNA polymerase sigma-70 factor (ECF subfamily)
LAGGKRTAFLRCLLRPDSKDPWFQESGGLGERGPPLLPGLQIRVALHFRAALHLTTGIDSDSPESSVQMGPASRFEELFLPHLDAAYNLARWLVNGDQDAQDIVQEAYVRAFKGFAGFRGDNPRAWLLTIVRNTAYTWIKRHAPEEKLIPFDEESHVVPVEPGPSELSHEKRRELLDQALGRLPTEFREVLVLFEFEGWSYKAMAHALEVPLGTVMSRLSRARRRLQQELAQLQPGEIDDEL